MSRFDYVKYDHIAVADQETFKTLFTKLEQATVTMLKPGRAQSLVLTKLEEAYMWVGKAIRDEQIARAGKADLQEDRTNS